jgi:hypothetical protein
LESGIPRGTLREHSQHAGTVRVAVTGGVYMIKRVRGSMLALRSIARRVLQLTAEERELAREIETITRKLAPH